MRHFDFKGALPLPQTAPPWGGRHPLPISHTHLAPSAPRLGSRLRHLTLSPQLQLLDPPMLLSLVILRRDELAIG